VWNGSGPMPDGAGMPSCRTRRAMWHSGVDVTTPERSDLDEDDDCPVGEHGRAAALSKPSLCAALLVLGLGCCHAGDGVPAANVRRPAGPLEQSGIRGRAY
jgi:hypothetical protein